MENNTSSTTLTKWLRVLVHVGSLVPLAFLIWNYMTGSLGFNPIQAVLQRTGRIGVVLLLFSLTCTPIHTIFNLPPVRKLRKPLGLYAALYAGLHFAAFAVWDYRLNVTLIWMELIEKPFIFIGLVALVLLGILAATSTRFWQRKLRKWWARLHRLAYLAAILVIVHYLMAVKGDLFTLQGDYTAPIIAGGILAVLFLLRLPIVYLRLRQWVGRY